MRRTTPLIMLFLALIACPAPASEPRGAQQLASRQLDERLDRGLIARPEPDGGVYLGWRLLQSDPKDIAFNVYRRSGDSEAVKLNEAPIRQTTDFVDARALKQRESVYFVRPVAGGKEGNPTGEARVSPTEKPADYVSIRLQGDYTFQKVGIADLDGDGRYDFVIKQPRDNIDPYEKYWKPSPDTYKLEAYAGDGKFLWRYDLGWSIERGIWYSPYLVYDLDGDGKAEVAAKTGEGDPRDPDGRVTKGPEYLSILDGQTGKPICRIDWPSREGFTGKSAYNHASRNQLAVAYLDGKNPYLLVERGTYDLMKLVAYRLQGGKLHEVWRWDNSAESKDWQGQGAHWMHSADIDGDGRDEVLLGSCVVDDNGKSLWTTGLGHPDHFYVGDIDPARPGLEIYYGVERAQKKNGMCMVDAKTGKILWGIDRATRHVHSQGMCSDIDAKYPGSECYSAESDPSRGKTLAWAMLHSAQGKLISQEVMGGFNPDAAYWDADLQRELVIDGRIFKYGKEKTPLAHLDKGQLVAVADILGDWREELVLSLPGELRIYTTTIPARDRRVTLMQDPIYRADVAHAAMGYYQVPMTSYDLQTSAKRR
jgi:rhamnogalacturonan endolyase